jgi:hypothetical protein
MAPAEAATAAPEHWHRLGRFPLPSTAPTGTLAIMSDRPADPIDITGHRPATARRFAVVAGAVVAVLAVAYVALWFVVADGLCDSVAAWSAARRDEGYRVEYTDLGLGGFPARIEAIFESPSVAAAGDRPAWAWRGPVAVVRLRPWDPQTVDIDLSGAHGLDWVWAGRPVAFAGTAGHLAATVGLVDGQFRELKLLGADIDLTGDTGRLAAATIKLALRRHSAIGDLDRDDGAPTPSVSLGLAARDLHLPDAADLPLGPAIAGLAAELDLFGTPHGASPADALAKWRDDGGTIDVKKLRIDYGPLALAGEGTLALDRKMQPIGAFTTDIKGFFETVDALRHRGLIRDRAAIMAKLILGVMAKRDPNGSAGGGARILSLPLTIQNRVVSVGPVPLATLPPIVWPAKKGE